MSLVKIFPIFNDDLFCSVLHKVQRIVSFSFFHESLLIVATPNPDFTPQAEHLLISQTLLNAVHVFYNFVAKLKSSMLKISLKAKDNV